MVSQLAKKALLLFSKVDADTGAAHPRDLVGLLNNAHENIAAHDAFLEDLTFYFDKDTVEVVEAVANKALNEYDVIYFRRWGQAPGHAVAAAWYCKRHDIPFVDNEVLRIGSQNKITQHMGLHEAGIPMPRTLIGAPVHLQKYYEKYGFSFPFILKSVNGTRGKDNYVVHDEAEMRRILGESGEVPFVLQDLIPNTGDYRVLVMGDKVVAVIERTATEGSHLNNTSQGGSAALVSVETLPPEVCALSIRAAQFFHRNIAGVDMVKSLADGQYYCFEVNRAPQIDHSSFEQEKAKLLAEYLVDLANARQ